MLFFLSMVIGTLVAISSYSWLSMWMGLEINLLSIIPLMSDIKNKFPSESALKYFITQALASSILLFSIVISLNFFDFFSSNKILNLIFDSALLMKVGAAPFHAWFPEVIEGLNWNNSLILLTWQKIAPMLLIFYNSNLSLFFLSVILLSTIFSGILGLNQISLRKILAYSSINHISWMLASMLHSQFIWVIYFLIYSIITLSMILIFKNMQIFYLTQFFNFANSDKLTKFFISLNFLSLGGLPPFLGFFPKWLVINNLVENNLYFLSTLLIVFTLITLYFYIRVMFSSLTINSSEFLIKNNSIKNFYIYIFNFISLSGLIICTLLFNYT
uniref:NADH-ubiquinone oxidoreductase chain 2 n=1 Tax=Olenecamptus bilobus TaxID=1850319 RepID=A0A7G7WQ98_9CUCU|nr:NADH dehydrogenase subunit 2 [Olenecamptus bilobus]QNH68725.1 NADH dehydrogenase subunit 2 [Olenecamptus bilobus]